MPLGWIDFSKSERNKVLSVLDLLSEAGTLDELGIAPVRDGFANLFFPGTSTIQTRAKYFMIVPYALKDLEYSSELNPNKMLRAFDEVERKCGEILVTGEDRDGIIGNRSLSQNRWVKRTPADIYWAGLRNYGIFTGGTLSLSEYVRAMCALKNQKTTLTKLGNRNDTAEEGDRDDKDAGDLFHMQFWKLPTNSMLAFILRNDLSEIFECKSFQDMAALIKIFPEQVQQDYALAYGFSGFLFVLRTVYNIVVSEGKNDRANAVWDEMKADLIDLAAVDLESIFTRLNITRNTRLCIFLRKSQSLMKDADLEEMKTEIKRRERDLKGSRSKTLHPGEFDPNAWFGGGQLDYRFSNAKVIIKDIFESEGAYAKSE